MIKVTTFINRDRFVTAFSFSGHNYLPSREEHKSQQGFKDQNKNGSAMWPLYHQWQHPVRGQNTITLCFRIFSHKCFLSSQRKPEECSMKHSSLLTVLCPYCHLESDAFLVPGLALVQSFQSEWKRYCKKCIYSYFPYFTIKEALLVITQEFLQHGVLFLKKSGHIISPDSKSGETESLFFGRRFKASMYVYINFE